jgi:UDP-N-acetylglucosamine 2-epimerase (non-hydrolysing)
LGLGAGDPYGVVTLHRPSNVDNPVTLMAFLEALGELGRHLPLLFPVHPRVKSMLLRLGEPFHSKGIMYLDPLNYLDFIALVSRARLVLTDSGGIQEETTFLGIPCLTLRNTTERPVTVTHGTNRVIGADPSGIVDEALWTLDNPPRPNGSPPLWDGRASERIVSILQFAGTSLAPKESSTEC